MKEGKPYGSAGAFRRALEERLNKTAKWNQVDVNRLRRQVAFDRLLARLFQPGSPPWALKGGYAMELRFQTARTTIDIDLTLPSLKRNDQTSNDTIREMLQEAASVLLRDWFEYLIGSPLLDLEAAPYGGARFPVEARMDARPFARFHLDVALGDAVIEPIDSVKCGGWLAFAGIEQPTVHIISQEQQFAEKVHAYTLPRRNPNSRVKDLIDLAILVRAGELNSARTGAAINITFRRRATHTVPRLLDLPPESWRKPFAEIAAQCLGGATMDDCMSDIQRFFADVLLVC